MAPDKNPNVTRNNLCKLVGGLSKEELVQLYMAGHFHISIKTIRSMVVDTINMVQIDQMNIYAEKFPRLNAPDNWRNGRNNE